jgi:D-alanine-D-alanine ligase
VTKKSYRTLTAFKHSILIIVIYLASIEKAMKKKIALVTGGLSGEAVISYKSAITVGNNIDTDKFDWYKIDINESGWWFKDVKGESSKVNREDFSIIVEGEKIRFDAVLLCIHGTPGEDGKLQGYFDMLDLPYTSCDAATSALTFNKRYTVAVAAFGGINVAKSLHIFKHTPITIEAVLQQLSLPVFVKPNNGGSSIGMSKVNEASELQLAVDKAFKEDNQILIEEFIKGREFTIGVFKTKGQIMTLPMTEVITKKEFFDFEAKYQGLSEEITPAVLDDVYANKIRRAAKRAYEVLNCRGVVRIDFILNEATGEPYMLEVNTVPGQSEASIIPQQVKAMGWTLKDFYTAVIEEAFAY